MDGNTLEIPCEVGNKFYSVRGEETGIFRFEDWNDFVRFPTLLSFPWIGGGIRLCEEFLWTRPSFGVFGICLPLISDLVSFFFPVLLYSETRTSTQKPLSPVISCLPVLLCVLPFSLSAVVSVGLLSYSRREFGNLTPRRSTLVSQSFH